LSHIAGGRCRLRQIPGKQTEDISPSAVVVIFQGQRLQVVVDAYPKRRNEVLAGTSQQVAVADAQ